MSDKARENNSRTNTDGRAFRSVSESIEGQIAPVLESIPDGIIVADTSGKIVLVNSQAEALFRFGRGELVSQEVEVLVPARFREYHVELRNAYIADPTSRQMGPDALWCLRQDGSEFQAEISLSPLQVDGELLIVACVRDVTHWVEVTDAWRTNEERVRLLLNSTVEAIYGLDIKGNCTFSNRACVDTLGYQSTEDLLGKNMHDLIHHTRPDGSPYPVQECKIYEAFRRGKGTHVDDEVLWKADGTSFPAEYRSFPLSRDGQLIGSVVTFLDVTEQRRVAEALRTQQTELVHAARLSTLGEMAAGLAHELNQPLTAISAFAEGALVRHDRGNLRKTEIAMVLSRIAEDAQRAGDIIRRLRNFVQKREAQRQKLDVNHVVRDVHKFVQSEAKHGSITLQFELGGSLPAIEADPIELQQVLLNLIRNAFDAIIRSDSDERTIVISTHERKPDRVEVVVEDSGPGISHELAEQVFEPFYTSKDDGLGIGLGICQNIIEAHGGTIWFGDAPMGGAGVHFDLPSHQQEQVTDEL